MGKRPPKIRLKRVFAGDKTTAGKERRGITKTKKRKRKKKEKAERLSSRVVSTQEHARALLSTCQRADAAHSLYIAPYIDTVSL